MDAHRRIEAGGIEGKLVLCPDLPRQLDAMHFSASWSPLVREIATIVAPETLLR